MFEYLKVGEMAMVQVLGLVEDKPYFFDMFLTKKKATKSTSWTSTHICVHVLLDFLQGIEFSIW